MKLTVEQEKEMLRRARALFHAYGPVVKIPKPVSISDYEELSCDYSKPKDIEYGMFELKSGMFGFGEFDPNPIPCDAIFLDGVMVWNNVQGYLDRDLRRALKGDEE